jgi:hypothetical protein
VRVAILLYHILEIGKSTWHELCCINISATTPAEMEDSFEAFPSKGSDGQMPSSRFGLKNGAKKKSFAPEVLVD